MALPNNVLQQTLTYQMAGLASLLNSYCFVGTVNTKFKYFEKLQANLGDTVTFDKPPRYTTTNSLVVQFQASEQRVQNLTVNNQISTAFDFSAQQFIFNVEDYMQTFGKSAIYEIGSKIEGNVAQNCVTNTYRFFGDGITPISSFGQLGLALAQFRNYGSAPGMARGYLEDIAVANIVNNGLNQFALKRNDEMAMSWELGNFSNCEWYQSNLLPTHIAGTEGQDGTTLTVVSVTKNSADQITAITFSGTSAASDPNSIKQYDKLWFQDGVSGFTNLKYLTFIGHNVSSNPVQFRSTADSASTAGSQVTVNISPFLQASSGQNQNINAEIQAGMQVKVLPSHRAGAIMSGNPLYLAMPQLPEEVPFPTANTIDPETGVSIRQYYGSLFGQNQRGMVYDAIWGSTLVDEYAMAVIFPL